MFYSFADFFISYVNWKDIKCDFWVAYTVDTGNKNNFPNTVYGKMMKEMGNKLKLWQYSHTGTGKTYGADGWSPNHVDLNYDYIEIVKESKPSVSVDEKQTETLTPKPTAIKTIKVGDKVILNGYLFSSSFGAGRGQVRKGTTHTVTRIADTKRTSPYLLDNGLGWVRKQDLTLVNQAEKTKAKENTKIKPIISKIKVGDTVTVKTVLKHMTEKLR